MYLNPQIHDTQDSLKIHVGYIGIHSRNEDTYLEPYPDTCGLDVSRAPG